VSAFSKVVDRLKLIAWALVFIAGVLLVTPIAFKVAGSTARQHGVVVGVVSGLFAAALVGFALTAIAIYRTSDLRRLTPEQKRKFVLRLYGAAVCFVLGIFLEVLAHPFRSDVAWPIAAALFVAVGLAAGRLRAWALSQAADWESKPSAHDLGINE
jgi:hypothetical protein